MDLLAGATKASLTTRLGIVEAMLFASNDDDIYAAIRSCRTLETAQQYLTGLGLTDEQVEAVLAMPLSGRILSVRHDLLNEASELRTALCQDTALGHHTSPDAV